MTNYEAWGYAAQWGSYMHSGDPGACMYGFDERFCVQSEQHRAACEAYILECMRDVQREPEHYDADELDKLHDLAQKVHFAKVRR